MRRAVRQICAAVFPAVVTGTIITMIGVVLTRVGVNWAGGGAAAADFGAAGYLLIAALVLLVILSVINSHRLRSEHAVLIGITVGYLVTIALGWTDFSGIQNEPLCVSCGPCNSACRSFIWSLSDHVPGHDYRLYRSNRDVSRARAMTGRKVEPEDVKRGFEPILSAPSSARSSIRSLRLLFAKHRPCRRHRRLQPLGLRHGRRHHAGAGPYSETGIHRRFGAAMRSRRGRLIMFGMVAATGIKILSTVDYAGQRNNVLVVAIAIALA